MNHYELQEKYSNSRVIQTITACITQLHANDRLACINQNVLLKYMVGSNINRTFHF